MNHKTVCWRHYEISVPVWANWLARDKNGDWFIYSAKPSKYRGIWKTHPKGIGKFKLMVSKDYGISIAPPEPGPWTDQLYWIGD